MKSSHYGSFPEKSAVHFLPMIDMKSTDYSCIYSTMLFISSQARKYFVDTILTLDQPFYWKGMEIKTHEEQKDSFRDLVLILGAFHTSMSFYGSIGHLMVGSGLQSILELIYAKHTVPHMLSGKAYSRATRGHLITVGALSAVLMLKIHDIEIDVDIDNDDFQEQFHNAMSNNHCLLTLANFLDDVLAEKVTCNNISLQEYMISVSLRLREFEELHSDELPISEYRYPHQLQQHYGKNMQQ